MGKIDFSTITAVKVNGVEISTLNLNGVKAWEKKSEATFTFGDATAHDKTRENAAVADICYYGDTPIGIVISVGDKIKIVSLGNINTDGTLALKSVTYAWGGYGITTGVVDKDNGYANTQSLIALGEAYKPAIACSLFVTNGTNKGDWYLPSYNEMAIVVNNITSLNNSLNNLGTSIARSLSDDIWTSTEYDYHSAYIKSGTKISNYLKNESRYFVTRAMCEI